MWKLLVPVLMLSTPCRGVNTSCQIPAVEEGQDTTLTCSFSDDVSKLQQDFKVNFYGHNTPALQGNVLDCIWLYGKPECKVHDCCKYDNHVSNTLQIRVLNVTQDRVGRYVCFVLPAGQESYQFCNLTIEESIPVTESKNNLHALAALVVIVVIIIVIVVFVFLIWRRTRKPRNNNHPDAWSCCHINLCRNNSEKVNNDSNQLISGDAESNSPKHSSDISSKLEGQHTRRIHESERVPLIHNVEHERDECVAYPNNRNEKKAQRDNGRNVTQHGVSAQDSFVQNIGQENITSDVKEVQSVITQESLIPEGKEVKNAILQKGLIPEGKEVKNAILQKGLIPEGKEVKNAILQKSLIPEGKVESAIVQESVIPEGKEVQSTIVQESVIPEGKEVRSAIFQESVIPEGKEVKSATLEGKEVKSATSEGKEVKSPIVQESAIVQEIVIVQESAIPEGKEVRRAIVQESVIPEGKEVQSAIVQESVIPEGKEVKNATPEGKEVKSAIVQESATSEGKEVKNAFFQESDIPDGNKVQNAIVQENVTPEGKEVQHTIAGSTTTSSDTHKPSGGKRGPPIVATEKGTITHALMQPIDVRPFNSSSKKKLRQPSKSKMSEEDVVYPNSIIYERYKLPSPTLLIPSSPDVADDKDNEEQSNRSSSYKNDIKGEIPKEEKPKSSEAYKEKTELKTDPAEKAETKREKKERKKSERKEKKERKKSERKEKKEKKNKEKAEQKKIEERKKMEAKEKKDKRGKVENNKEANQSVEDKFQEVHSTSDECKLGTSDENIDETDSSRQNEAKELQEPTTTPSETPQEVPELTKLSERKISKECIDPNTRTVRDENECEIFV